jgi:hypothetical protein
VKRLNLKKEMVNNREKKNKEKQKKRIVKIKTEG